jgi:hypothetical protein
VLCCHWHEEEYEQEGH